MEVNAFNLTKIFCEWHFDDNTFQIISQKFTELYEKNL